MGGLPPFALGHDWNKRASRANPINRRVFYDPSTDREYEPDPNPSKGTWHEIDWRRGWYRDIDPETGERVRGSEGEWRPLR